METDSPAAVSPAVAVAAPLHTALHIGIAASLAYFLVYFTRVPIFVLPDVICKQSAVTMFGKDVTLQESLSLAFALGNAAGKYPAAALVASEFYQQHRALTLYTLVGGATLFCTFPLALARTPFSATLGLFIGSMFQSCTYPALVRYLEGRVYSEALLGAMSFWLIVGGGAGRAVGSAVAGSGIDPYWMPALVASAVTPVIWFLVFVLDKAPGPSAADQAARAPRKSMTRQQRSEFIRKFWPGLLLFVTAYSLLTALRQFRDMFSQQILDEATNGHAPSSAFVVIELPGAIVSSCLMACFVRVTDNQNGLRYMLWTMGGLLVLVAGLTIVFETGAMNGIFWQICVGCGVYGAYAFGSSAVFDRLVSAAAIPGTCTFLISLGDLCGYGGTVGLLLWKTFSSSGTSGVLDQFEVIIYALGGATAICLVVASVLFDVTLNKGKRGPENGQSLQTARLV
mmetsp:Transcript_16668/g.36848  ORF Transcript_16668/g.36848 Transcript_16668/m.36848 type:complete len:455 (+) Transcript_16668:43-1407(+)